MRSSASVQIKPLENIFISRYLMSRMRTHVVESLPEEACGLLVCSADGRAIRHFPIENNLHNATRYRMNPVQQLKVLLWMEKEHLDHLVIYHSHPDGPDHLSENDINQSFYPDAVYLLWYHRKKRWFAKTYRINSGLSHEIRLFIK